MGYEIWYLYTGNKNDITFWEAFPIIAIIVTSIIITISDNTNGNP